ncbi:hypothetical protein ACQUEE_00845 [Enterococcus casseliflavus]|uniref:hypothetical protein n=1 Tax=Enterococcus casseliflavus TaxID=37734 RepID=UPI003D0B9A35
MNSTFMVLIFLWIIQAAVNFYYLQKREMRDQKMMFTKMRNLYQEEKALIAKEAAFKSIADNYTFDAIQDED